MANSSVVRFSSVKAKLAGCATVCAGCSVQTASPERIASPSAKSRQVLAGVAERGKYRLAERKLGARRFDVGLRLIGAGQNDALARAVGNCRKREIQTDR